MNHIMGKAVFFFFFFFFFLHYKKTELRTGFHHRAYHQFFQHLNFKASDHPDVVCRTRSESWKTCFFASSYLLVRSQPLVMVFNFLQVITEYTGYDNTKDPTDWQASGNAMRVFALRWHDKYDHIFVTGGWDRQLKVSEIMLSFASLGKCNWL